MTWFTGSANGLFWFVYTPRFFGGAISGSLIARLFWLKLKGTTIFKRVQVDFYR